MHITIAVDQILHYLLCVVVTTALQIFILIGPGLILAFFMNMLSSIVQRQICRLIGLGPYLLFFGWLGTIVHELGHLLFCKLFGYKIIEVKLFAPNLEDSELGRVRYAFSWLNPYQVIGSFFVGIGPIILGALVLYYSTQLLLGPEVVEPMSLVTINSSAFNSAETSNALVSGILNSTVLVLRSIFAHENLTNWRFYIFLYITFCVGSSITLSMADVKTTFIGFITFVIPLFMFNLATIWIGYFTEAAFMHLSQLYGCFYAVMTFVLIMNAVTAAILLPLGSLMRLLSS